MPDIDFTAARSTIPAQPQPVSMGPPSILSAWFSFNQTKTGDQIDELCELQHHVGLSRYLIFF